MSTYIHMSRWLPFPLACGRYYWYHQLALFYRILVWRSPLLVWCSPLTTILSSIFFSYVRSASQKVSTYLVYSRWRTGRFCGNLANDACMIYQVYDIWGIGLLLWSVLTFWCTAVTWWYIVHCMAHTRHCTMTRYRLIVVIRSHHNVPKPLHQLLNFNW